MIDDITQIALGGVVALLILREVFGYLIKRKDRERGEGATMGKGRSSTDRMKEVKNGVDAVLARLDRIIERLEDIADQTRAARKQTQISVEHTETVRRQLVQLERALSEIETVTKKPTSGLHPAL